ncbi:MAG: nucleoside 2-deoxyribosyltransferase domain-containing protein [Candidatus Paceibacterota bacterium]
MANKTKIHLPRSYYGNEMRKNVRIEPFLLPTIFLAGPIRNAPKWQEEAIKILLDRDEKLFVSSPTRELSKDLMSSVEKDNPFNYQTFERQRAWEQYYLNSASQKGCIIFWLPREAEPKEFPDKVYAHITMMELGEWIARKKADKEINIVFGSDGNFPEWSTILYEIASELPTVPIRNSLEDVIDTAIQLCRADKLL